MPQKPYPGDEYIKQLITSTITAGGYLKQDANRNWLLGGQVDIDSRSMDNIITASRAIVRESQENKLFARNVEIYSANGCTVTGADHIIGSQILPDGTPKLILMTGDGPHYLDVSGDGNIVGGYSSRTGGTRCINMCWFGVCFGQNITIGRKNAAGKWVANEFKNSQGFGNNIIIEGNNSHANGSWIKIEGDNISVTGNGTPGQYAVYKEPGEYRLNPK